MEAITSNPVAAAAYVIKEQSLNGFLDTHGQLIDICQAGKPVKFIKIPLTSLFYYQGAEVPRGPQ